MKSNWIGIASFMVTCLVLGGGILSNYVRTQTSGDQNSRDIVEIKDEVVELNKSMNGLVRDMVLVKTSLGIRESVSESGSAGPFSLSSRQISN